MQAAVEEDLWQDEPGEEAEADLSEDVSADDEAETWESSDEVEEPMEVAAAEPDWVEPDDGGDEPSPEEVEPGDDEPSDEWDEKHTDEIVIDDSAMEEPLPIEVEAVEETVDEFEATEPEPFTSGPFTFGEGDPFGDETDDQATPVRAVVEPQVELSVPVGAGGALVRPGDNQLQLRLQGTGAIAESGQVRALDIEVPVPGSWVGNRRVTLQLRLTLSPVPEDDDGGQGGAP